MFLTYSRTGSSARTLVLLHALPLDKSMFDNLEIEADLVCFSAPGFDGSTSGSVLQEHWGDEEPSLDTYAKAVLADLDELGIDSFDLGGLSMGGPTAIAIYALAPERVRSLILMDTNIGADAPEAAENRRTVAEAADRGEVDVLGMRDTMTAEKTKTDRPEVYADITERLSRVPADGLAWIQRAMANRPDRRHLVATVDNLLLVRGAEDGSCSAQMMEDLIEIAPQGQLTTIEDAGHFTALETPRELSAIINGFLSRLSAG